MMRRCTLAARAAVLAIVALGTSLRLLGISFGLPYHHHWDEGWVVESAAGMLRRHDDVPASYQYGAPLIRLTELVFVMLGVAGKRHELTAIDAQTALYFAARIATALVSSTGIVAVYLAARWSVDPARRDSVRRALAASLLYAVASELVLHSRYGVTDASLVALTAWTLAFAARYLKNGSPKWALAMVLASGVTAAFKAPGIMTTTIAMFAGLTLWRRAGSRGLRRRHLGVAVAVVPIALGIYVLLNPHVVDRWNDAFRDLYGRYRQTRDGGFSSVYLRRPGIDHLTSAIIAIVTQFPSRSEAVSLGASAVIVWGIVGDVLRRRPLMTVAAAYAVCLVLSVALPNRTFLYRNYLVVIPTMCLGFGAGIVNLGHAAALRLRRARWLVVCLAIAAFAPLVGLPLREAIRNHESPSDSRVRAVDWIAEHVSAGQVVDVATTSAVFGKLALGGYPELREFLQRPSLRFAAREIDECPAPSGGPRYIIAASYRDTHKAPSNDPWQPVWRFRECPGYEQAAIFSANPSEVNLRAYPTWPGRAEALVLRRVD